MPLAQARTALSGRIGSLGVACVRGDLHIETRLEDVMSMAGLAAPWQPRPWPHARCAIGISAPS